MLRYLLLACVAFTLSACAGAMPWNPQGYGGISRWEFRSCVTDEGVPYVCRVSVWNGKEGEDVLVTGELADGTKFEFQAKHVSGIDAIRERAKLEAIIAEQLGDVAPGIIESILDAAVGPVP